MHNCYYHSKRNYYLLGIIPYWDIVHRWLVLCNFSISIPFYHFKQNYYLLLGTYRISVLTDEYFAILAISYSKVPVCNICSQNCKVRLVLSNSFHIWRNPIADYSQGGNFASTSTRLLPKRQRSETPRSSFPTTILLSHSSRLRTHLKIQRRKVEPHNSHSCRIFDHTNMKTYEEKITNSWP